MKHDGKRWASAKPDVGDVIGIDLGTTNSCVAIMVRDVAACSWLPSFAAAVAAMPPAQLFASFAFQTSSHIFKYLTPPLLSDSSRKVAIPE
jgi:hypothetical protein